jgi:asparagine synthase (glutamine-hydrolysing)
MKDDARLVSLEVLEEYERNLPSHLHPWLQDIQGVPPSWFQLITGLIVTTSTWLQSPFGGDADSIFIQPLASQPLVEAYSHIPPRFHLAGGYSGAVARRAFAGTISEEVLTRGRSKGTAEMWLIDMVERSRSFLLEFLLEGILVRQGILDRKKVEGAIKRELYSSKIAVADLILQLYIEAWLQKWSSLPLRAVA